MSHFSSILGFLQEQIICHIKVKLQFQWVMKVLGTASQQHVNLHPYQVTLKLVTVGPQSKQERVRRKGVHCCHLQDKNVIYQLHINSLTALLISKGNNQNILEHRILKYLDLIKV